MRADRFRVLKELINQGAWEIDLTNGEVVGKKGGIGSVVKGYLMMSHVYLNGVGYRFKVHEIIAVAGGLNPTGATVDHINSNKVDNRLCNLQILSREVNTSKANKDRTDILKGSAVATSKLSEQQVLQIKAILLEGSLTQQQIADHYRVSQRTISKIALGRAWKQVEVELC